MKILDMSAGKRNIWFNRLHPETVFVDIRWAMAPTVVADTRHLPFPDGLFDLMVFDPPHMVHGQGSTMGKYYGSYRADDIHSLIRRTSDEAYRVSKDQAWMAF